jgi:hypothetical protein
VDKGDLVRGDGGGLDALSARPLRADHADLRDSPARAVWPGLAVIRLADLARPDGRQALGWGR